MVVMWRKVFEKVEKMATTCGLEEVALNENTIRIVGGEKAMVFNAGVPPMSCNSLYLAHAYGLADVRKGEVASFYKSGVALTSGEKVEADVVLTCIGFGCNEDLLEGHFCQDSWFIDGKSYMTHNLRGDRVNGTNLLGSKVKNQQNFLISYFEDAQEYERCICCLNMEPEAFAELQQMEPSNDICENVALVDYFTTITLSNKLANLSSPQIQKILEENRQVRKSLYDRYLTEEKFLEKDKAAWEKLSTAMAQRTGKPMVAYPFA
jgi:hypothetical protein